MPIKIPGNLPAVSTLERENIFVMEEARAVHQDIRPLKIAVLNLMPTKITTETQLIRLLSNSSLQIDLTLLSTASHKPKHTSMEHMNAFYKSFYDVKEERFDGLVITGAPLEDKEYSNVDFWPELTEIMEWSKSHVFSTFHICWAAQAALYYHYNIKKYPLDKKMFGVYEQRVLNPNHPLLRGFDETFFAPQSRHTEIRREDILKCDKLELLSDSLESGVYIVCNKDSRMFFVTGHSEYDFDTLDEEYKRDVKKGLNIDIPFNYYPDDDPSRRPQNKWRAHAHLLFSNWLNYEVYQNTPYDLSTMQIQQTI